MVTGKTLTTERILSTQLAGHVGQRVRLEGWLHNLRDMGEINFLLLRDRAGLAQAVLSPDDLKPLDGLKVETVLALEGVVVATPQAPGGHELHDVRIDVLAPVTEVLPFELNKHRVTAGQAAFLDHAVIGHRHPNRRAILRIASGVMAAFRNALTARDFTEIQTPKLVASATESGANVFAVEYFGQTAYLAQSPQFYKQIMVGVFERVFEVGPVFRAEPHSTPRHINEYVSLDAEFGFIKDHFDVMAVVTEVVRGILDHLRVHHAADLDLLEAALPALPATIPHLYYPDAHDLLLARFGIEAHGEPDLAPEHERALGRWARDEHGSDFLFVTGYPMAKRPFYTHPDPNDPTYSNSFDLLFRGAELVTGGQRLHRYADYVAAARRDGLKPEAVESYLEAFRYGMPPHGGFAVGLERFVMQLLDIDNIRLATLFPRDMTRLAP
ncbi:MAG: aspartate--tRNA(Asn) ligase [Anaerolineae bacterium]